MDMKDYITFKEAAKRYNMHEASLRNWVYRNKLSPDEIMLIGTTYLVKVEAIERVIKDDRRKKGSSI